jgi:hypothetical protein
VKWKLSRSSLLENSMPLVIFERVMPAKSSKINSDASSAAGGGAEGFVYDDRMKTWLRMGDSGHFAMSTYFSTLTSLSRRVESGGEREKGDLSKIESSCAKGLSVSSISVYNRQQGMGGGSSSNSSSSGGGSADIVSRAHCEDRMVCSLVLGSIAEYRKWLGNYVECVGKGGGDDANMRLRILCNSLLEYAAAADEKVNNSGGYNDAAAVDGDDNASNNDAASWTARRFRELKIESKEVLRNIVLPIMGANRSLQRLTGEVMETLSVSVDEE